MIYAKLPNQITVRLKRLMVMMTLDRPLPGQPRESRHRVEVTVAAEQRQSMLAAQRRNPDVIRRNWRSSPLQLGANGALEDGGLFVYL